MNRIPHWLQRFIVVAVLFAAAPSARSATEFPFNEAARIAPTNDTSLKAMRGIVERFTTDREALERYYNIRWSDARRERLGQFLDERSRSLDAVNFAALDQESRIDHLLLRNEILFQRQELDRQKHQQQEVAGMLPFAQGIVALEEARRKMEPLDSAKAARTVTDLRGQIADAQRKLEEMLKDAKSTNATGKVLGNRAARMIDELRRSLRTWNTFYSGYDPEFSWWMKKPFEDADKALNDYAGVIRKKVVGAVDGEDDPVVGDPIGREALLAALQHEMIPYTPEELIKIAEKEFEWCEKEYKRAAQDMGLGDDWRKALEKTTQNYMKPGEQPKLIRQLADEAVTFLEERNLVTIPTLAKQLWRMEMMTPERQKVNPYFTGGEVISVSFPTDGMGHEEKLMSLRGNSIHLCRATVHHELIPGHHLQLFMAARFRTHRAEFRTPFLVEGWALYWEMLLWDLGFPKTPEDRVGMLFWRSHRCARIIFSLKFHLGQMTAPQAIDFLVERVGHERRNATGEVRRSVAGDYGPLYQAAYMLGGLQIRGLRKELVETGKMTDRDFHDAILRENAIPIEFIRASLGGQALTKDFASQWRFYDVK